MSFTIDPTIPANTEAIGGGLGASRIRNLAALQLQIFGYAGTAPITFTQAPFGIDANNLPTVPGAPLSSNGIANKTYVDTSIANIPVYPKIIPVWTISDITIASGAGTPTGSTLLSINFTAPVNGVISVMAHSLWRVIASSGSANGTMWIATPKPYNFANSISVPAAGGSEYPISCVGADTVSAGQNVTVSLMAQSQGANIFVAKALDAFDQFAATALVVTYMPGAAS